MGFKNTDIFGRKVFFIMPDSALVPLSFMEELCTLGFESHILNRSDGPLAENIKIITEHFPDAALIFNIDSDASKVGWYHLMRQLRQDNVDVAIGAVFVAKNPEHVHHVETEYESAVTSSLGCIALSHGDEKGNFNAILSVLEKSGAKGRRNNIRAKCNETSYVSFSIGGRMFHARADDVNISHICCILDESGVQGMRIYDKVRGAHICVNGFEFSSDIVLIMKRNKGGVSTAVFMFIKKPDDESGIESELEAPLNKKIYEITSTEVSQLFRR